jgi:hypothetical protein
MKIRPYANANQARVGSQGHARALIGQDDVLSLGKRLIPDH